MKKALRTLCAALVLTVCLCLPAFAQEAKPAEPSVKEDKTISDLTGFPAFLRNSVGFTTNFGGPYCFEQADHKSPIQAYGETPAEGSVAVLRLMTSSVDRDNVPINTSGHAFISVTNVSQQEINVGGLVIAPDTTVTIGTRGNRNEHAGIWYNLESYYQYYLSDSYYINIYSVQVSLDQSQLDVVNRNLEKADHWSAIYNCTAFTEAMWNSVCSDTLSSGGLYTPTALRDDLLAKYADKAAFRPEVPYDYIVYYGKNLTHSKEFV